MDPTDLWTPEQREQLARDIADSRRELEKIVEDIDKRPTEVFDEEARQALIGLLRQVRADVVLAWHRVNSETAWPGALRGPIKVDELSPLLQGAMVETLTVLDVQPRFLIEGTAVERLVDHEFPDGTAVELTLGDDSSAGLPLARLGFALAVGERYLVLLGGWLVGKSVQGEEWPKAVRAHSRVGSLRADRWPLEDVRGFILRVAEEFHAEVAQEVASRALTQGPAS